MRPRRVRPEPADAEMIRLIDHLDCLAVAGWTEGGGGIFRAGRRLLMGRDFRDPGVTGNDALVGRAVAGVVLRERDGLGRGGEGEGRRRGAAAGA